MAGFEIDFATVAAAVSEPEYSDVTSFPEVREDLAVIVPDSVTAAEVVATALSAGRPLLARPRCSMSTGTQSGSGPAMCRWPCGSCSAPPIGR